MPTSDLPVRVLWHMGALHPFEQGLTLLLAFGPFVVLGLVIRHRSREHRREDAAVSDADSSTAESPSRTAQAD